MFGRRNLRWMVTFGRFFHPIQHADSSCKFFTIIFHTDGLCFRVLEFGAAMTNTATKIVKILQIVSLLLIYFSLTFIQHVDHSAALLAWAISKYQDAQLHLGMHMRR